MTFLIIVLCFFGCIFSLGADEELFLDWDFDSLFDEPMPQPDTAPAPDLVSQIRQRGITFNASYLFAGGAAPGWDDDFSWGQHIRMRNTFRITSQLSQNFRAITSVFLDIPSRDNLFFKLGDFFFDYIINDAVFIRAGKFNFSWGISPNFGFSNILARTPENPSALFYDGDPYFLRLDIPIGVGGLQLLALSRARFTEITGMPGMRNLSYGAKYNLALTQVDINFGFLYHYYMPLRSFISFKTTLGNTEIYSEWLLVNLNRPGSFSSAFNLGFFHEFFNGNLSVNGEVFYNREGNSFFLDAGNEMREPGNISILQGFNAALNLLYRIQGWGSPRIFLGSLYEHDGRSARLIPGIRITPWPDSELYIALSVPVGNQTGHYFDTKNNSLDPMPVNDRRLTSLLITFTIRGSVQASHFF